MSQLYLNNQEFLFLEKYVIQVIKNRGAQLWAFGSRVRGDHQKYSDIDLMYHSEEDLSKLILQIRSFLEESNFPYIVELINEKKFSKAYMKNYLKERILL